MATLVKFAEKAACLRRREHIFSCCDIEEFSKHLKRQHAIALGSPPHQLFGKLMPLAGIPVDGVDQNIGI